MIITKSNYIIKTWKDRFYKWKELYKNNFGKNWKLFRLSKLNRIWVSGMKSRKKKRKPKNKKKQ